MKTLISPSTAFFNILRYFYENNRSRTNLKSNTNTGGAGFTLIEIILTVAIIAIIAGSSYVALIHFSRGQSLNSAYGVLKNNLNLAKSLASSQVVNCSANYTLVGYEMYFPSDNTSKYEIRSVCQNTAGQKEFRIARDSTLSGITITSTISPILFLVISGEVQNLSPGQEAKITLTGNGTSMNITVFPNGRIE